MREGWIQGALQSKQSSKPFGDNMQRMSQELVPVQSVPQADCIAVGAGFQGTGKGDSVCTLS